MHAFLSALWFSVETIAPIVALIVMGFWLKRRGEMRKELVVGINQIVFKYALPALLFFSVVNSNLEITSQWRMILAGYLSVLILFFGARALAKQMIKSRANQAIFIQGVFRGNLAIVGLAMAVNVYGDDGYAVGSIVAGSIALLLNILAIITLESIDEGSQQSWWVLIKKVWHNPLVIGINLAIIVKLFHLSVPKVIIRFGDYFVGMTLPLALLCIGATFNLRGIFGAGQMAIWASVGRVIVSPIVFVLCGLLFGLQGQSLAILYFMGAAPAATAGYVMAKAMGGNEVAAANIIAITTASCLVLLAPPIIIFRYIGWM